MQDYDSKLFTEEQIERALEENNIRAYFLEVDFKDLSREYNTGFQFAKGEVNSGFICFKLLYGESGIILKRGCTVYANIRKTTGETFKSNLSVLDYQNGIVLLSLSSQVLSIVGVDRLELAVIIDEEKTISPKIKYKVYESFDGDDKADAENHPPLLDSEDLRLLITELRKEVEVNKVNIEDLTEKAGSNLKLIQSNTTKINSNTSEIEKIKQYNTNNDSKISNIENSIEENTNSISTNTNKIGELENKANTNESNISSNASKIELIEGEIETLKQYDSSNDTKISEIESKVDTNKSGIANNSSKIEQAISKIEENKTNISGNSSKISVLENKIPTIESKISGHTSKIEVIEGKIPTVESGILDNASNIDKLEKKIPTIETNISGNSSNITKIEAKVESLETSVSGNSSSIEEVKGEVTTIKSSISSNTSEVSKLKEKLSGMEPNVTSVVSKVEEIERQIPAIESRISGNTSNISTVKTKVEKNTSDITKISKRLDGLVVNPNVDLEEIVQARTATTGEIFDTLDERIDHEVDRLNKKIDVTMLQQEDKENHVIENTVEGLTTDMIIKGRTLQNLMPSNSNGYELNLMSFDNETGVFTSTRPNGYLNFWDINNPLWKQSTQYTIILEILENTLTVRDGVANIPAIVFGGDSNNSIFKVGEKWEINILNKTGVFTHTFTTRDNFSELVSNKGIRGFVRDSFSSGQIKLRVMAIEGALESIPNYFRDIKSFGELEQNKISILSSGANLINPSKCVDGFIYQSDIDKNMKTSPCFELNLVKGTTYFFTEEIYGCYLDNSRKFIENVGFVGNKLVSKYTGIAVFRPHMPYSQENSNYKNLQEFINKFMVNEGQNLLPYEPYKCNKKDILLNQYGFENGLNGINDINDELNSIRNVAIKKINKYINSNNETINIHTIRNNTISFNYNFIRDTPKGKSSNPNIMTNCFETNISCYSNDVEGCFGTPSGFFGSVLKTKLESQDINGIAKYVRENFKECYYELAEPVETPLDENINLKTFGERTYVSFENAISGTSSFKAPVNTVATISRLNRENRALEEENKTLRQDFESTTLSLTDSDLELVKQNVDMDFRLMEVEFALDIPQSTLSSNINFKNKKGEVKSMARTPYEMMKIVILSGDYDREDYIHKVRKYYERGRMTKEEHDELMSLMTADEVISKKN